MSFLFSPFLSLSHTHTQIYKYSAPSISLRHTYTQISLSSFQPICVGGGSRGETVLVFECQLSCLHWPEIIQNCSTALLFLKHFYLFFVISLSLNCKQINFLRFISKLNMLQRLKSQGVLFYTCVIHNEKSSW